MDTRCVGYKCGDQRKAVKRDGEAKKIRNEGQNVTQNCALARTPIPNRPILLFLVAAGTIQREHLPFNCPIHMHSNAQSRGPIRAPANPGWSVPRGCPCGAEVAGAD